MGFIDHRGIDRVPTRGERWAGIVLSGLLAVLFLTFAAFLLTRLPGAGADRRSLIMGAAILAAIGLIGVFLLYRFTFTSPKAASARARLVYLLVTSAVPIVLLAKQGHVVASIALFVLALGVLARMQLGKGGSKDRERGGASGKSLERARER